MTLVGWARALLVSVLLAIGAVSVSLVDPFGLDSAADKHSRDVMLRLLAPLYQGGRAYGSGAEREDPISVIGISESDIKALNDAGLPWTGWPAGYDAYADLIKGVAAAQPKAVFMDFFFFGPASGFPDELGLAAVDAGVSNVPGDDARNFLTEIALATRADAWVQDTACHVSPAAKIACIRRAGGIPIIIGKPHPQEVPFLTELQKRLDRVAVLTPLTYIGFDEQYPLRIDYDSTIQFPGVHGYDLSPAAALYLTETAGVDPAEAAPPEWFEEPFTAIWGSRPPADYAAWRKKFYESTQFDAACRNETPSPGLYLEMIGRELVSAIGGGARSSLLQRCVFTPEAPLAAFYLSADGPAAEARFLTHKIVMIGSYLSTASDFVRSPVHGDVPGVHWHAAALDNLLHLGSQRLYHDPPTLFTGTPLEALNIEEPKMVEFGLTVIFSMIGIWGRVTLDKEAKRRGRLSFAQGLRMRAAAVGICVILAVGAAFYLVGVQRYIAFNIFGMLALAFVLVLSFMHRGEDEVPAIEAMAHHRATAPVGRLFASFGKLFSFEQFETAPKAIRAGAEQENTETRER